MALEPLFNQDLIYDITDDDLRFAIGKPSIATGCYNIPYNFLKNKFAGSVIQNWSQEIILTENVNADTDFDIEVDNNIAFIYNAIHENYDILDSEIVDFTDNIITLNLPYPVKTGERITVRYAWTTQANIIPPDLLITIANKAYTQSNGTVILTFDLVSTNPVAKYVNLNITLNGETRPMSIHVGAGLTVNNSITFTGLAAGTYTATFAGDITDSLAGIVVPALVASYTYTMLDLVKLSNTSIKALCTVTNTGDGTGTTFLKVKDGLAGNIINTSSKTIAIGETVTFEHTFTGLSAASHTIYFQDSAGGSIDNKTMDLTLGLPIVIQRNVSGYTYGSQYYPNQIIDISHSASGSNNTANLVYINFLLIGVNPGFTAIKLIYPNYQSANRTLSIYKYLNYPSASQFLLAANCIPANFIKNQAITIYSGNLRETEIDLGAAYVAWAAGKTELSFVLVPDSSWTLIALSQFKLKFEY